MNDVGIFGVLFDGGGNGLGCAGFEQCRIRRAEFPRFCFLGLGGDSAGLDLFLELKPLDLVGRGPWQRFDADHVVANALIFRQFATEIIESVTDRFFRIGHAGLLKIGKIRHDNGGKFFGTGTCLALVVNAYYGEFGDERAFEVMDLEILGVNVFA